MSRPVVAATVFGCTVALTAAFTSAPVPRLTAGTGEQLLTVSATSARNAWAVGQLTTLPPTSVVLHWNGTSWSHAAIPDRSVNHVNDIGAVSADNAWLVGWHCTGGCATVTPTETTLVMHWDGTTWSRVPSPNVAGTNSTLSAVSVSSAGNAWAAGEAFSTTTGDAVPLILHWNGTKWSKVASPSIGEVDTLTAVTIISGTDAWAVGYACTTGGHVPLVLHWNGRKWSAATLPVTNIGGLFGVAGAAASDVWAVGDSYSSSGRFSTSIYHWSGTSWSTVAHPGANGALFGATATSRSDAWAVGSSCIPKHCAGTRTLTLHWNGTAWSHVPSPSPGTGSSLADVAATSPSDAWAVGEKCTTPTSQCAPLILHWNGTAWAKSG